MASLSEGATGLVSQTELSQHGTTASYYGDKWLGPRGHEGVTTTTTALAVNLIWLLSKTVIVFVEMKALGDNCNRQM